MRKVEDILRLHGKSYHDFNLPNLSSREPTRIYNAEEERRKEERLKSSLNTELIIFYSIMSAIREVEKANNYNYFFLDGPAGSGKTFLYNTLMSVLRGEHKTVIPVALTGIAATLVSGGRIYHSQFKLPIKLKENSTFNIRHNFENAKLLKNAFLIIWDESTMATHYALDAVDRLLKDLMDNQSPFGGKVILLGGDFRQCLTVVKHANRTVIVESSIKFSRLWSCFKRLKLNRNMRTSGLNKGFNEWLIN